MKRTIDRLKLSIEKGFFYILGSRVINNLIRFISSVIVVRILSKEAYGSFSYAMNILEFFLLLNGLGVVSTILQFCSERKDRKEKLPYLKYGLKIGTSFNILIVLAIVLFTQFFELPIKGSKEILFLLGFTPILVGIYEIMGSYLRADLKNKEFSFLGISHTFLYLLGTAIGGYLYKVHGIIVGRYIAFIFAILIGIKFLKHEAINLRKSSYPIAKEKKEFFIYSIVVTLTNSISQILFLLDIFLIGIILKKETIVASYRVAMIIPFALTFIPKSVITFVYPYFAQNYKNKRKIKSYFNEMQKYLIILNSVVSVSLIIFAPLIIKILFGSQYLDSVVPFRILAFGYFFVGSFRIPAGNVIASIRKVKINLYNAVASGVLNVFLDIILIYKFGSVGAAMATSSIFIVSSVISNTYLYLYFKK